MAGDWRSSLSFDRLHDGDLVCVRTADAVQALAQVSGKPTADRVPLIVAVWETRSVLPPVGTLVPLDR
jgi:hypothetical protein